VYHQQDGQWVDEQSDCSPSRETAQVLLETEKALLESGIKVTCLRFSGIYGGGRKHLVKQVLSGNGGGSQWTNRIHSEDCALVIAFLIARASKELSIPNILNATDDCPVPAREVRSWIAKRLGVSASTLRFEDSEAKNKRCRNTLLKSLGYRFKYPSFREGFSAEFSKEDYLKNIREQMAQQ
jgi:nucleoside-diphosphate-sugar epimerase